MAKHVAKSGLAAKLGQRGAKAVETHREDETTYSSAGELPAGIEGGIAQLVECKFDVYKKGDNQGEYFFYAAGVVTQPAEVGGIPVEGLRTSIMEPMCETPSRTRRTVDDHVAWVLNALRRLGADTSEASLDDLEALAEGVKDVAPYFRFRTWKGQKQTTGAYARREPTTQHEWGKVVENYSPEEGGGVDDQSGEKPDNGEETDEAEDLMTLGEAADAGDEDAQARLTELAEMASIDPNDYAMWAEVADLLAGGGNSEEEEADAESDEEGEKWKPARGEVYGFKPKGQKKALDCEVVLVDAKGETVNLKNLSDGKTIYKGVPWDKLVGE